MTLALHGTDSAAAQPHEQRQRLAMESDGSVFQCLFTGAPSFKCQSMEEDLSACYTGFSAFQSANGNSLLSLLNT